MPALLRKIFLCALTLAVISVCWIVTTEKGSVRIGHQYQHSSETTLPPEVKSEVSQEPSSNISSSESKTPVTRHTSFNQNNNLSHEMKTPIKKLSSRLIDGVKKFLFFVGYARSGHSIIGALLDAHPHVVISDEFFIFKKFPLLNKAPENAWKDNLFDLLYQESVKDAGKKLFSSKKGYTLAVDDLWQGKFEDHIEVIGDKSGGKTTGRYRNNKTLFKANYRKLKDRVAVPLCIIHAVRNPFDIVSTVLLANKGHFDVFSNSEFNSTSTADRWSSRMGKYNVSEDILKKRVEMQFMQFEAVVEMIDEVFGRKNVLEVHNCDLVADPRGTLVKIFRFLEVDTTENFLDACAAKVFKSVSHSRDAIVWPQELREMVEQRMKNFDMLQRYSFTSD